MKQLTEEELKERRKQYNQRYLEKLKAKKAGTATPDWESMYNNTMKEVIALKEKTTQLENLCKSYATQAENANTALKKATLEYNARIQFMLDSVRHALVAMQLAVNAENKGDK